MYYDENIDENRLLFFEATLNSLNDLIVILDASKKIIYVNNAARCALGYTIKELFEGGIELIDRDITLWQLQRVYCELQNAGKVAFESWHTAKEGKRFPIEVNIYTYDYGGKMYTFYQAKDITQKRLIEKSVAKIRTQYRMLIEGSTDAIAMYDMECKCTFANQTLARVMGKSVYELVGSRPSKETHNDSMTVYEAKMIEAMRTGEALEHELYLHASSDAKPRYFNISIAPEYDEECEVVGVMCRARDITDVKEAETHLNAIIENLPDMVCRLNTKGRFTFVSSLLCKNFYTPKEFFLGKNIEELKTNESERDRIIYEAFKNAVKFGCQSSCEAELNIRNEKRRFLVRVIPEKNERYAVIGALCIATDITELKKQEELLFANEEKFRTLVENAQECIARYDSKCKAVYLNPVMERTLGVATAKARGKSALELAISNVCHEYEDALRSVVKSGKPSDFYFTAPIDNSYWHVTITPEKNRDKECIGVMTVGRNITTLRDMQIELKRREEYQRTILDNSPYFVWLKDENSRLLAANNMYAKRAKVASAKELEGKSDFDFF